MTFVPAASLCVASSGQNAATPKLVDPFPVIIPTNWLARLDNFAVELQNDSAARGYIIAYPEKYTLLAWQPRRSAKS